MVKENSYCSHGSAGWIFGVIFIELELELELGPFRTCSIVVAPALGERFLVAFEAAQK